MKSPHNIHAPGHSTRMSRSSWRKGDLISIFLRPIDDGGHASSEWGGDLSRQGIGGEVRVSDGHHSTTLLLEANKMTPRVPIAGRYSEWARLDLDRAAIDNRGDRRGRRVSRELAVQQGGNGCEDGHGDGSSEETIIGLHLLGGDLLVDADNSKGAGCALACGVPPWEGR